MGVATQTVLGPDEIEAYRRDGFVIPRFRLPSSTVSDLQKLTAELLEANPEFDGRLIPCPHVRRPLEPGANHNINTPHPDDWMRIATQPAILNAVQSLLGPDLILWGTALFYKRAAGGPETPWHNDAAFVPIQPHVTTTVWIAVFDSKIDNGCLRCIPGSHLKTSAADQHFNTQRPDVIFPNSVEVAESDEATARDIELEAGQMLMFDFYTIHGARANLGTRHRAGFTLRFMPSTSHFDRNERHGTDPYRVMKDKDYETRPLFLVRGIDRGRNDFQVGHAPK